MKMKKEKLNKETRVQASHFWYSTSLLAILVTYFEIGLGELNGWKTTKE